MQDGSIFYPSLVQEALRGIVRLVLQQTAETGLPGDHHFYIGFRTSDPGVVLPADLRSQFPEEMTVVLQNWFQDLEVDEDAFSVTLRFSSRSRRLTVPFAAVTRFVDPSASFGLQFDQSGVPQSGDNEVTSGPRPLASEAAGDPEQGKNGDNVVSFERGPRRDGGDPTAEPED